MSVNSLNQQSRIYRKLGFFMDQSGIMRRYLREKEDWKDHLENTKSFILKCAADKGKKDAAILGSGWLLDVPLAELSKQFDRVWLFDIFHPKQVITGTQKFTNVTLISTDISGFALSVYKNTRLNKLFKPFDPDMMKSEFDFDLSVFDFVVSCNILNQLDIILMDYLKKRRKLKASVDFYLRKKIQDVHINMLPKGKSCLISDMEELWVDENKRVKEQKTLVYTDKLSLKDVEDKWIWKFDNHFSYHTDFKTWFNVVAINI